MKIVRYFIAGILILFGFLVPVVLPGLPKYADAPAGPLAMGLVFVVWGVLLVQYQVRSYRGGAASIVGAFLLGIGIWAVCGEFLWNEHVTTRDGWTTAIAAAIFVVAGLALLMQGHRIHKENAKQTEDI